jgi:hypothetical protein
MMNDGKSRSSGARAKVSMDRRHSLAAKSQAPPISVTRVPGYLVGVLRHDTSYAVYRRIAQGASPVSVGLSWR